MIFDASHVTKQRPGIRQWQPDGWTKKLYLSSPLQPLVPPPRNTLEFHKQHLTKTHPPPEQKTTHPRID